jgi:hypothetical protein
MKSTALLVAALEAFKNEVDELGDDEDVPELDRKHLEYAFCKVAKVIVPNIATKVDEIVIAHELKQMRVNEDLHGADLTNVETGAHIEIKTSVVKRMKGSKANFNWNIVNPEDRDAVLRNVREKVGGGGEAIYRILDSKNRVCKEYRLSEAFIIALFQQVPLRKTTTKINMGSTFCWNCKVVERLEYYMELQKKGPPFVIDFSPRKHTCRKQ